MRIDVINHVRVRVGLPDWASAAERCPDLSLVDRHDSLAVAGGLSHVNLSYILCTRLFFFRHSFFRSISYQHPHPMSLKAASSRQALPPN